MEAHDFFEELISIANSVESTATQWKSADPKACLTWYSKILLEQAKLPREQRNYDDVRRYWRAVREHGLKLGVFDRFKGDIDTRKHLQEFLKQP